MAEDKTKAKPETRRAIAVLDKGGVLIGRVDKPTDAEWDAAAVHCRFPNGFDNALKRYRLIEWRQGRWRFEPIVHAKDAGAENTEESKAILPVIARIVHAGLGSRGAKPRDADLAALDAYLKSFDGQG